MTWLAIPEMGTKHIQNKQLILERWEVLTTVTNKPTICTSSVHTLKDVFIYHVTIQCVCTCCQDIHSLFFHVHSGTRTSRDLLFSTSIM